jgi:hypothetical protein
MDTTIALGGISSIFLIISSNASRKSSRVTFLGSLIVGMMVFPCSSIRKKLDQFFAEHPSKSPPETLI